MAARVLYVLKGYPQISQTYVKSELEAVWDDYDVSIVCHRPPDVAYANHYPYAHLRGREEILAAVREARPDVLHTHYLNQVPLLSWLAHEAGVPYTVRAHSFDALSLRPQPAAARARSLVRRSGRRQLRKNRGTRGAMALLADPLCLGVLVFPFTRRLLVDAGAPEEKLIDSWPVIAFDRFHDRSPNGDAVMNTGAAIPKKRMEDFLRLAALRPGREFNLYALGYETERLRRQNEALGGHATIRDPVEPDEMPAVYKRHRWLVYTGCFRLATVGWPMAVAEAQAAGVGVCVPRLRPDLSEFVGEAGVLYDRIEEVAPVIDRPVPESMREAGFEQARRSDVAVHKRLLTELWDGAARHGRAAA